MHTYEKFQVHGLISFGPYFTAKKHEAQRIMMLTILEGRVDTSRDALNSLKGHKMLAESKCGHLNLV